MIKNQWYIACFEDELKKQSLIKRKIVGEEIVIFKNDKGEVGILQDRCCHRNVHLSLGYVKGENLKCGYHGWEYNNKGECVHIPMLDDVNKIPSSACVKRYPMKFKYKAYWVYIGETEKNITAEIPDLSVLDEYPFVHNKHILKANIKLVAESLFDAQHLNHVHRNSIKTLLGKLREPKTEYEIEVKETSLFGKYKRINNSSIFEKIYFGWQKDIDTRFAYWYPHTSLLDSHFPKHLHFPARRLVIFEHFYEIDEEHVMMMQITAWKNIFRFNPWFAKYFMRKKSDTIVEEDIAFLESNRAWHSKIDEQDLILKNDEPTLSFMKLWNKNRKKEYESVD